MQLKHKKLDVYQIAIRSLVFSFQIEKCFKIRLRLRLRSRSRSRLFLAQLAKHSSIYYFQILTRLTDFASHSPLATNHYHW